MTSLWLLLKPHALLMGSGLALALGSFALGYHVGRPNSPVSVQVAHTNTFIAHDTVLKADTVVQTRSKILTKTLAIHDTLRLTERITDTVWVKQFVQSCDSVAASCADYRVAAQSKFHADSILFAAQAAEIGAWKASQPSKLKTISQDVLYAAAGFGICRAGLKIPFP